MAKLVTMRQVAFQFDGSNDEEIMAALNEDCHLVSTNAQNLTFTGMDSQTYSMSVGDYVVVTVSTGWPSGTVMDADQYAAKFTEIATV